MFAAVVGFVDERDQLAEPRFVFGVILAEFFQACSVIADFVRGVFPCVFRGEIGGHIAVALGLARLLESWRMRCSRSSWARRSAQFVFVGLEIAEAGDHVIHIHRFGRQDKLAAEVIEALEVRERHRAGQQAVRARPC